MSDAENVRRMRAVISNMLAAEKELMAVQPLVKELGSRASRFALGRAIIETTVAISAMETDIVNWRNPRPHPGKTT